MRRIDRAAPVSKPPERLPRSGFRGDIEGLRAVAVLAVVLFHARVPGVDGGFVGVDVFFVISGFLITGLLWREVAGTGTVRLGRFYGARARRLLPASALVGLITMLACVALLSSGEAASVLTDGIASALYVGNYWFIVKDVSYFNAAGHLPPSPFQHYWSLGVEEQFYLVWPALIIGTAWLIRRARHRRAATGTERPLTAKPFLILLCAVAAGSFAFSYVITYVWPAVAFFSLPTRAWQLAAGGLIALTAPSWGRLSPRAATITGWTGLALIALACTRLNETTVYPGTAALLPTLGAALTIAAGCAAPAHGCSRLLDTTALRAIGRLSYSWYLWHWPVLIFVPLIAGHPLTLPARLATALLSAVLAWLTLRLLENPLRFAPAIRTSPRRSLTLGGVATAAAVITGLILLTAIPNPTGNGAPATPLTLTATPPPAGSPPQAYTTALSTAVAALETSLTAGAELRSVPSNLAPPLADAAAQRDQFAFGGCVRTFFEAGQPECAFGDSRSPTTVVLLGDSHAAMLFPAFHMLAEQRPWRVETLAKAGCPPVDVEISNRINRLFESLQRCRQWRTEILQRLREERPALVVISAWRQYGSRSAANWQPGFRAYDPAWLDTLGRLVTDLRDTGTRVLVLGPIPDPGSVVPVCLSGHLDDVAACTPDRATAVNAAGIAAESQATQVAGGDYFDLTDLFCTVDRCPVIVGNTLVYLDRNHLTIEYARLLAPVLGLLADRVLAQP